MNKLPKWVHIVGICGVVTSGIAVMFKNLGVKVTGSDKGFFPPVSDYLSKNGITIGIGYKPERLTDDEGNHPDLVVIQGLKGDNNVETEEARSLNLNIQLFPKVLSDFVVCNNSIVVAGTYGKTTITAILVEIFSKAGIDISYMFGGLRPDMTPTIKAKLDTTKYSIIEGDEYLTSLADKTSKFFYYNPKFLLLNSCQWEHPDLFPTEEEYVENFRKLVISLPADGLIVANANDKNVVEVAKDAKCRIVYYSANKDKVLINPDWFLETSSKPLSTFIKLDSAGIPVEIIPYEKQIIGEFNDENMLAATVLSYELGVKKERIQEALIDFDGIKRRLEIKFDSSRATIIDDFGSSPPKAKGSLSSIRMHFPKSKIVAVFEPNTGNRTPESIPTYKGVFDYADKVIFPRFTKLPKSDTSRLNETELASKLEGVEQLEVVSDDEELVKKLVNLVSDNDQEHVVVVFLGSHGFRGIIDKFVEKVRND